MNKFLKPALILLSLSACLVYAFYWNEARKELRYLCGNFSAGDTVVSVRRQLDTGNLLQYHAEATANGSRITAASPVNFSLYRCIVDFDPGAKVLAASHE